MMIGKSILSQTEQEQEWKYYHDLQLLDEL